LLQSDRKFALVDFFPAEIAELYRAFVFSDPGFLEPAIVFYSDIVVSLTCTAQLKGIKKAKFEMHLKYNLIPKSSY
jgi:hypothetical protein